MYLYSIIKTLNTMKTVQQLNENELEELRLNYLYDDEIGHDFASIEEIPDEVIFQHFGHITFVEDDFFCNL